MKTRKIGGYFGLELSFGQAGIHPGAIALSSGRTSLSVILKSVKPHKIYIPFYICDSIIEVIERNRALYEFYSLNDDLEISETPVLGEGDLLLYVNYFDLKRLYLERLTESLGDKLVIDNSQAFYPTGNGRSWLFNSARKFFGVPDGSYLYCPRGRDVSNFLPGLENKDYGFAHLIHRFEDEPEKGYAYFKENEASIGKQERLMSRLTKAILSNVDYERVATVRRRNYQYLEESLSKVNRLSLKPGTDFAPFCYPFLCERPIDHARLWRDGIYVSVLWEDCVRRRIEGFTFERSFSQKLLPLPIDQRYSQEDLDNLLDSLEKAF